MLSGWGGVRGVTVMMSAQSESKHNQQQKQLSCSVFSLSALAEKSEKHYFQASPWQWVTAKPSTWTPLLYETPAGLLRPPFLL